MLFNSYEFLFGFLPVVVLVYYKCLDRSITLANSWLCLASLGFYAWWSPAFVGLLLCSVAVNYAAGRLIGRLHDSRHGASRLALLFFVALNLGTLSFFKYFNFFSLAATRLLGVEALLVDVVLPLGISFYTFTQISYLADIYLRRTRPGDPVSYLLFVTYFPHLIAGPILHHAQMLPQFRVSGDERSRWTENMVFGSMIFSIGLFKKVCVADPIGRLADEAFETVAQGGAIGGFDAWCGALSYAFQLYFDFSGYSDMAIGLSKMLGIRLPINFASPYKAESIIDFWRRWHMSLSRFLQEYLYVPLGGNRLGAARRYINVMVTMLLGGLWHGASWTFVLWGAYHGVLICMNHLARDLFGGPRQQSGLAGIASKHAKKLATFVLVVIGWVIFRAGDVVIAGRYLGSLLFIDSPALSEGRLFDGSLALLLVLLYGFVSTSPNSQQIVGHGVAIEDARVPSRADRTPWYAFRPSLGWAFVATATCMAGVLSISTRSAFLYFQF